MQCPSRNNPCAEARNEWADELSKEGRAILLQKDRDPGKQFQMSLEEVLLPKQGQFFPKDYMDRVQRCVGRFQQWLEALGTLRSFRQSKNPRRLHALSVQQQ